MNKQLLPFDFETEIADLGLNKGSDNNCWVCQGYNEVMFKVTLPERYQNFNVTSVFIHLEFENYEPMVMKKKET